jgi:hypothetical protein
LKLIFQAIDIAYTVVSFQVISILIRFSRTPASLFVVAGTAVVFDGVVGEGKLARLRELFDGSTARWMF